MSDEVPTEPPVAGAPDPPLAWHAGTVVTDAGGAAAGPTTRAVPPGPADPTVAEPATAAFPTSPDTETGPDGGDGGDGTGDDGRGSDEPAPAEKQPKSTRRVLLEWGILIAAALLIAFLIKTFLFQAFYIPSESMVPTLNVGDRVLVNKLSYDFHDVNRGDIVVFEAPPLARSADIEDLVKRVIGLPGETVEAHDDGHIYINGRLLKEPYLPKGTVSSPFDKVPPNCEAPADGAMGCKVPAGRIFVMGDNRRASKDARVFGPVKESTIVGRVFLRIWPVDDIGFF